MHAHLIAPSSTLQHETKKSWKAQIMFIQTSRETLYIIYCPLHLLQPGLSETNAEAPYQGEGLVLNAN